MLGRADWLDAHAAAWQSALAHDVVRHEVLRPMPNPTWTCVIIAYRSKQFLLEALDVGRACALAGGATVQWLVVDCGGLEPLLLQIRTRADIGIANHNEFVLNMEPKLHQC